MAISVINTLSLVYRLVPVSVRGASREGGHVSYQLSVWRPNAELMQLLKEGQVVRLINTAATQTK